jgi:hypothetical protein
MGMSKKKPLPIQTDLAKPSLDEIVDELALFLLDLYQDPEISGKMVIGQIDTNQH